MTSEQSDWPLIAPVAVLVEGRLLEATLLRWDEAPEDKNKVKLELNYEANTVTAWSEDGYFRALCEIRKRIEPSNALIVCYGASENVYPSPMIESMGYSEKAYRLKIGMPALTADLVFIFDVGPDIIPSTVNQQKNFYELWLESLR